MHPFHLSTMKIAVANQKCILFIFQQWKLQLLTKNASFSSFNNEVCNCQPNMHHLRSCQPNMHHLHLLTKGFDLDNKISFFVQNFHLLLCFFKNCNWIYLHLLLHLLLHPLLQNNRLLLLTKKKKIKSRRKTALMHLQLSSVDTKKIAYKPRYDMT